MKLFASFSLAMILGLLSIYWAVKTDMTLLFLTSAAYGYMSATFFERMNEINDK